MKIQKGDYICFKYDDEEKNLFLVIETKVKTFTYWDMWREKEKGYIEDVEFVLRPVDAGTSFIKIVNEGEE